MDLATDVLSLLPTHADVAEYRRRGWWVSGKIVPDALLNAAIEGSERYYRGDVADGPSIPEACLPHPPMADGMRKHDYASLRQPALAELARLPVIAAIGARLAGAAGVRLWHDQLLYKPPAEDGAPPANVGWHTDRSYWRACSSEEMLTAWVPFHDVTAEHGALTVLDGSCLWSDAGEDRRFHRQDLNEMEAEIAAAATGRTPVKVPITLERGQVSFHHCRTFHGSGPNLSSTPRRSLAIHLQPLDNRFSGLRDDDGNHVFHMNNRLVRSVDGEPDYTDERYCPVLWPI